MKKHLCRNYRFSQHDNNVSVFETDDRMTFDKCTNSKTFPFHCESFIERFLVFVMFCVVWRTSPVLEPRYLLDICVCVDAAGCHQNDLFLLHASCLLGKLKLSLTVARVYTEQTESKTFK